MESDKPYKEARLSDAVLGVLKDEAAEDKSGLLLIDMPTGYGKSYAAQQFLPQFVLNEANDGRNIFYITNQKKNLPTREAMKKAFASCGYKDADKMVDRYVIWVKSVIDMMEENATDDLDREMPYEFKEEKWRTLLKATNNYREIKNNPNSPVGLKEIAEIELRGAENTFRAYISRKLSEPDGFSEQKGNGKTKLLPLKKRIRRVEQDPRWQWLGKLYPTAFTRNKRIFLMSVNKFLVSNISVVEGSYKFIDDGKLMKNAVVIIDEFDSSKKVLQEDIISNAIRGKAEPIALLRQIHKAFEDNGFPAEMLRVPEGGKGKGSEPDRVEKILNSMKKVVFRTYDECKLKYNFKSEDDPGWQDFIFHDYEYRCASDKKYYVVFDKKERHNHLESSKKNSNDDPLTQVLGQVKGALQYCQNGVSLIAENYQRLQNSHRAPDEAELSYECALFSVLDQFGIVGESAKEFMASGASFPFRKDSKGKSESADLRGDYSVYERGIHFVHLENSEEHKERTRMSMYAMQDTPEKVLLRLCEKCFVIGLSATGTYESVLCNYDLRYLRDSLESKFKKIPDERMEEMAEAFERQNAGYDNVGIEVGIIDDAEACWRDVFTDEEISMRMRKLVLGSQNIKTNNELDKDFNEARYLRICRAYKNFLEHEDIRSMLCLTMVAPGPGKAVDSNTLSVLFKALEQNVSNLPNQAGDFFAYIMRSSNFDADYASLRVRLENGEKLFIVAAYETMGTGVNLQYKIPAGVETVQIYELENDSNEKDFDAIYVDRPTGTAPWLNTLQNSELSLLDNLYRICELRERAEIDGKEYIQSYTALLNFYASQKKKGRLMPKGLKERPSAKVAATKCVKQAVGRICRSNHKNRTIYIFADAGLMDAMDLNADEGCLLNKEYSALLDALSERRGEEPEPFKYRYEAKAADQSDKLNERIQNVVRFKSWNEEKMIWWRNLRDTVLKYPTLVNPSDSSFARRIYADAGRTITGYSYEETGDYGKMLGISFSNMCAYSKEVSEEAAALPTILKIPGVRELFERKGWATSFEPANFIMTPVIFNNIYKGALGEAVGKFILEQTISGLSLKDIEDQDKFERFDYVIKDSDTYVDFKHWQGFCGESETAEFTRIKEKMVEVGAKRALVINLLGSAEDGFEYAISTDHSILTVPYLYDAEAEELSDENLTRIGMFIKMGVSDED